MRRPRAGSPAQLCSAPPPPAAIASQQAEGSGAAAAAATRLAPLSAAVAATALPHSHLVPRVPRQMMLRCSPPSLRLLPSPSLAALLRTDPVNFHPAPAAGCSGPAARPAAAGGGSTDPAAAGLRSGATPAPASPRTPRGAERREEEREGGPAPGVAAGTHQPTLPLGAWLSSPAEAAPVSSAPWRAPTPARRCRRR